MTVKELIERLRYVEERHPEHKVVVVVDNKCMGGRMCSEIIGVGLGFDWEHGRVNIKCKDTLIKYDNKDKE